MAHFFTPEEAEFIREHAKGRGNQELTDLFNAHFNLDLTLAQIKAYKKNHNLSSCLTGWFKPGQVPFNKGRKGVFLGGEVAEKIKSKYNTNGRLKECYLYMNSHYFTRRECISFNKDGFIGFAGWADQRNTNPIIDAFIKWCDVLAAQKNEVA